jgi:hypothetical protein
MVIHGRHSITSLYYYITPLFIVFDYLGGINIRVAVLDSMPFYKNLYYGFCILCGIGMFALPRYTPLVALFESMIIILLIVLAVFIPYIQVVMQSDSILESNWEAASAFAIPRIVNLVLAGTVAIFAFHGSLRILGITRTHPDTDSA